MYGYRYLPIYIYIHIHIYNEIRLYLCVYSTIDEYMSVYWCTVLYVQYHDVVALQVSSKLLAVSLNFSASDSHPLASNCDRVKRMTW